MLLPDFIAHLERAKSPLITAPLAVEWATQPQEVHPAWWTSRLVIVRGFAKYLQTIDPRHHVPPLALLPHRRTRTAPYIYEPVEITALLDATAILRHELRVATYRTFLGLLAVSGLRTGEAIALDDDDVDLRRGVLVIRKTKFGKTREVPLHRTTIQALVGYLGDRNRFAPRRLSPASSSRRQPAASFTKTSTKPFCGSSTRPGSLTDAHVAHESMICDIRTPCVRCWRGTVPAKTSRGNFPCWRPTWVTLVRRRRTGI
jgi:integrase